MMMQGGKFRLFSLVFLIAASLVFLATSSAPAQPAECPAGINSLWTLDESSGDFFADAVSDNNGTGAPSPTPTAAQVFGGQLFDGADGINVPADSSFDFGPDGSLTIAVWIKRSSGISSAEVAVGRDDPATQLHWWTGLWGGGEAAFVLIEKDGTGSNVSDFLTGIDVIADGNWHLIVVVRDGATNETRLYVDFDNVIKTAPDDSVTIDYDSGFDSATEDLNIGHLVPGGFNFDGTLDEVAIYNRVLSEAEIAQHYNSGAGVSYCDPLARHELTVNPAPVNGTVNPPGGVYFEGRELEVTPVPDATFAFDGWSGDLSGFSNPASLVMDAAKTISAAFRADGDNDGASDAAEDAGPNGGDADSSGTLDSAEAYIASFNTADGQDLVTLEEWTLRSHSPMSELSPRPVTVAAQPTLSLITGSSLSK
jgi:hypothetical protein